MRKLHGIRIRDRLKKTLAFIGEPKNRPITYFLIAGSLFGIFFAFSIPPMQGADEPNHLMRAYQISEGGLNSKSVTNYRVNFGFDVPSKAVENVGGSLPTGIVNYALEAMKRLPGSPNEKYDKKQQQKLANIKNDGTRTTAAFTNTAVYSPVSYAPDLPGIWVARVVGGSPQTVMYAARLSALVIGLLVIALAIYLMPFGKLPFAVIALLPMSVLQLSIVTADTMLLAFSFLAIALTTKLSFRPKDIDKKEIALLLVVYSILALTKPGLFAISLISLGLLRNSAITKKKAWLTAGAVILTSLVVALTWNGIIKNQVISSFESNYQYYHKVGFPDDVIYSYSQQLDFIIHQPFTYLRVLYQSFLTTSFNSVPTSFVGNFGWQDTQLPLIFVIAGFILIALSIFISSQSEEINQERWLRVLSALSALVVTMIFATSLYLLTVPVKYSSILGYMQGRYFIPSALLLTLAIIGGKKYLSDSRYFSLSKKCLSSSVMLLAIMGFVVIVRYYNAGDSLTTLWHKII